MLSLFTTAKPFRGHINVIQRNALRSWKRLHPDIEIILFGDDEGSAEIAREFGIRHMPQVRRSESNVILLDDMFAQVQTIARHDTLCYVNCDIILLQDFRRAVERVKASHAKFLMIGRRWDTDITEPIDFHQPDAEERLRRLAQETGTMRGPDCIDYFVYPKSLYSSVPAFAVGRLWWDQWLVWKALECKQPVIDASPVAVAVHQNHDYNHHPQGWQGVWRGPEPQRNLELAGGRSHLRMIDDAESLLCGNGERRNWKRFWARHWRALRPKVVPVWFAFLRLTRPLRKYLGLRSVPSDSTPSRAQSSSK